MVQWVAIIVIVLAVLEGFVYGCVRSRYAAGRHGNGNDDDVAAPVRDPTEVRELTSRLMADISDTNSDIVAVEGDECSICLDGLVTKPSKSLPCGHRLHTSCLEDYLAHELREGDAVSCPLCRGALVVRTNGNGNTNANAGAAYMPPLQVAVHVNARAL
jgi:hypothetical protein